MSSVICLLFLTRITRSLSSATGLHHSYKILRLFLVIWCPHHVANMKCHSVSISFKCLNKISTTSTVSKNKTQIYKQRRRCYKTRFVTQQHQFFTIITVFSIFYATRQKSLLPEQASAMVIPRTKTNISCHMVFIWLQYG